MLELILELRGVSKSFRGRRVLDGLDLHLYKGECIALLGPNGAGKSTAIKLALGLTQPDSGCIEVTGQEMPLNGHIARQSIGVVPQYDALDPDFTVFENLVVFGRYFKIPKHELHERSEALLTFAALQSRRNDSVNALSGGMKRRLVLARALINNPKLLFLDEPTTALDPQAKHLIWDRLMQLKRNGMSLFLTTHFMDEAQRLADRVAVLDRGNIIAFGTPAQLIEKYVGQFVLEVWGEHAAQLLARVEPQEVQRVEQRGETFFFKDELAMRLLDKLKALRTAGVEYLYRPGNLEDVFFCLTGKDLRDE